MSSDWTGAGRVVSMANVALLTRQERPGTALVRQREVRRVRMLRGDRILLGRLDEKVLAENETQLAWPAEFFPRLQMNAVSRRMLALELDGERLLLQLSARLLGANGLRLFEVRVDGERHRGAAPVLAEPFGEDRSQIVIDLVAPSEEAVDRRSLRVVVTATGYAGLGTETVSAAWSFQEDAVDAIRNGWWDRVDGNPVGRLVKSALVALDQAQGNERVARRILSNTYPGDTLGAVIRAATESLVKAPRGVATRDWNRSLRQANLADLYVADPAVSLTADTDDIRSYEPSKSLGSFLELCRRLRAFGVLSEIGDDAH